MLSSARVTLAASVVTLAWVAVRAATKVGNALGVDAMRMVKPCESIERAAAPDERARVATWARRPAQAFVEVRGQREARVQAQQADRRG